MSGFRGSSNGERRPRRQMVCCTDKGPLISEPPACAAPRVYRLSLAGLGRARRTEGRPRKLPARPQIEYNYITATAPTPESNPARHFALAGCLSGWLADARRAQKRPDPYKQLY